MSTDVNTFVREIPKDLLEQSQVLLALTNLDEIDRDVLEVLPPSNIAMLVLMERTEEQDAELAGWIQEQQELWKQVEELASTHVEFIYDQGQGIPGWRAQPWAMALESKWGAGLARAVSEAEAWFKSR